MTDGDIELSWQYFDQVILATLLVIGGCILTFWGAKLFRTLIFFIGFLAGTLGAYFIINTIDMGFSLRVHLLVSFGFGIMVGALCVMIYKASLFTIGALSGFIGGQFVWKFAVTQFPNSFLMHRPQIYNPIALLICALIGGWAAFKLMEVVLRALTAFVGSFCVTSGMAYFVSKYVSGEEGDVMSVVEYFRTNRDVDSLQRECQMECYVSLGIWVTFFLSGVVFQYKCKRCKPKRKKSRKRSVECYKSESNPKEVIVVNQYHKMSK